MASHVITSDGVLRVLHESFSRHTFGNIKAATKNAAKLPKLPRVCISMVNDWRLSISAGNIPDKLMSKPLKNNPADGIHTRDVVVEKCRYNPTEKAAISRPGTMYPNTFQNNRSGTSTDPNSLMALYRKSYPGRDAATTAYVIRNSTMAPKAAEANNFRCTVR